jgi:hypothetical protein
MFWRSMNDLQQAESSVHVYWQAHTVHRPGDNPRKECEECGNTRGSNVRYYPT